MRRSQVPQDLGNGDVVRVRNVNWPEGTAVTGPVYRVEGAEQLWVGGHPIRTMDICGTLAEFEVVSRAPRPLYVNHPRTEPVPGDVVRDADASEWNGWIYLRSDGDTWLDTSRGQWSGKGMPKRLRLLVDGSTGQVVP